MLVGHRDDDNRGLVGHAARLGRGRRGSLKRAAADLTHAIEAS